MVIPSLNIHEAVIPQTLFCIDFCFVLIVNTELDRTWVHPVSSCPSAWVLSDKDTTLRTIHVVYTLVYMLATLRSLPGIAC